MFADDMQEKFYGEFKSGLLGRRTTVSLFLYGNYICGTGAKYYDGNFQETKYEIEYKDIKMVENRVIDNIQCLVIDYRSKSSIIAGSAVEVSIYLPNLEMTYKAIEFIQKNIEKWEKAEQRRKEIEERRKQEENQRKLEELRKKEDCAKFYSDCYEFHIRKDNNPYYELHSGELEFACIYVSKNKSLNFLRIDGNTQEDDNAYISYDKIHYYEKAGSIHYTESINGSYSSFGGTISGATISKAGTLLGGLLCGPMGMAAGAVLSHKPQKVVMPTNKFDISSETRTIDDRSVILNFYSDAKRQYIDIELPTDIYNFLQTHLPEKKYDIVLEMEKNVAVQEQKKLLGNAEKKQEMISVSNDMDAFESKVKKLKLMYDNGLLSEEEFAKEKARLLESI